MRALPPFGGTAVAESPDTARGGLRFSFLQSQGMPCTHVSSFGCCHKRLRFLPRLASHLRPGSVTFLLDDWPLFAASPRRHLCVSRSAGISAALLAFEPGSPVHPRGRASGCPTPAAASRPAWPAQQGPGHHGAQPRRGQPCRGRPALARPGSSFGPDQAARGHASPGHAARYPSEHGESSQRAAADAQAALATPPGGLSKAESARVLLSVPLLSCSPHDLQKPLPSPRQALLAFRPME